MGRKQSNQTKTKAYAFEGHVHVLAGRVKVVSHSSCRKSAIFKYFISPEGRIHLMLVRIANREEGAIKKYFLICAEHFVFYTYDTMLP